MTPKELKLWKKYRESVDKLNAEIKKTNDEKSVEYWANINNLDTLLAGSLPAYKSHIEPSVVGFYDFISGYTKKEIKK